MRRVEHESAIRSDGVVTLAAAALPVLARRHHVALEAKARVVPTCVDLHRFALAPMPQAAPLRFVLSGTVNRLYDVPSMVRLVDRARRRRPTVLHLLSPGPSPWDADLDAAEVERASARPDDVAGWLADAHVGLSMWRADLGDLLAAAMPTKIGELLAVGRPVVVNPGLGDMDEVIGTHHCGVVVGDLGDDGLDRALDELDALVADPDTPARCRAAAEAHFDLERGIDALVAMYDAVTQANPRTAP